MRSQQEIEREIDRIACLLSYCSVAEKTDLIINQDVWKVRKHHLQNKLKTLRWVIEQEPTLYIGIETSFPYFYELEGQLNAVKEQLDK